MPVGLFGITNDGLNLAVNLIILFLVVVYIALIVWTYMDARRRLDDGVLVGAATVAAMFPFVGPLVYSIVRPPEYLDDRKERELEIRASELRVRQLEEQSCQNCGFPIERTYLRCPSCKSRVKDPCESCGKPVDPRWPLCPYCEAPQRRAASAQAAPSRRRAKPAAAPRCKPVAEGARRPAASAERRQPPARKPAPQRPARTTKTRAEARPAGESKPSSQPRPRESTTDGSAAAPEAAPEEQPRPAKT